MGPYIAHLTVVVSPAGVRANSTALCASNGSRKSSLSERRVGGVVSAISMLPLPTSLLPSHAYCAPLPLVVAPKIRFIAGSRFSHGDHEPHCLKSFRTAKILS